MSIQWLILADGFLHLAHLGVIGFNLFGWIHPATRFWHRLLLGATAAMWLILGPLIGTLGYCPLTDWHWQVKRARGATDLPYSYIDYMLQAVGVHASPAAVDAGVAATFAVLVVLAAGMWWRDRLRRRRESMATPSGVRS